VDVQSTDLDAVVKQIGDAVLATAETLEQLCQQVDTLAHQSQQHGYQIFALSDAVQTLAENQDNTLERLDRLTETLQQLVLAIQDSAESGDPL
jgi:ABC-type transporter Mla subunit MlaD